jgi:hypothetical protein
VVASYDAKLVALLEMISEAFLNTNDPQNEAKNSFRLEFFDAHKMLLSSPI